MMNAQRWIVFAGLMVATYLILGWGDLFAQAAEEAALPGSLERG